MAIVITSITPTAATTLGGTLHNVVGTGLNTVKNVLVNNVPAQIVGTPGATALTFRAPPQTAAGTYPVRFLDATTGDVVATDSLVYTLITAPEALISQSPARFRLDVNAGTADTPAWVPVRGMTDFKPGVDDTSVDDSDYSGGYWGSDTNVQGKWANTLTVKRGLGATSGSYDPGQELLRSRQGKAGRLGSIDCRWYDIHGGDEAYRGTALVKWSPNGGPKASLDTVSVTLNGQGARLDITNPSIADPTLAIY